MPRERSARAWFPVLSGRGVPQWAFRGYRHLGVVEVEPRSATSELVPV